MLAATTMAAQAANDRAVLIANQNFQGDSILKRELYDIFTLDKTHWDDGTPIMVVTLPPTHDTSIDFVKRTLKVKRIHLFFRAIDLREKDTANHVRVLNDKEAIDYVENNPNAIGYTKGRLVVHASRIKELSVVAHRWQR